MTDNRLFKLNLNSEFENISHGNCIIYIHKNFRNAALEKALAAGPAVIQKHFNSEPVTASKFSRVHRFSADLANTKHHFYLKEYLYRSTWDFVKHLCRKSRARRAFEATLILSKNNLNAPAAIALVQYKTAFICKRNFLLTEEIRNCAQLYKAIAELSQADGTESLRRKRDLISSLGRTIGRMHAAGIFHGDLRAGNVLVGKADQTWQFFFIDNERTRKFRRLPNRLRLKNLVQTNMFRKNITRTDRLRFFKSYLQGNPMTRPNRTKWAKKVVTKTTHRLTKK